MSRKMTIGAITALGGLVGLLGCAGLGGIKQVGECAGGDPKLCVEGVLIAYSPVQAAAQVAVMTRRVPVEAKHQICDADLTFTVSAETCVSGIMAGQNALCVGALETATLTLLIKALDYTAIEEDPEAESITDPAPAPARIGSDGVVVPATAEPPGVEQRIEGLMGLVTMRSRNIQTACAAL